jgi:hypothetical protein
MHRLLIHHHFSKLEGKMLVLWVFAEYPSYCGNKIGQETENTLKNMHVIDAQKVK